jgi:phenylalanyl-tRNA synthetase alpha chain
VAEVEELKSELLAAVAGAADSAALEAVRVAALGKQGRVTALLKTLGGMGPDERAVAGPAFNGLREAVQAALAERKAALSAAELDARLTAERQDMSLPLCR